MRKIKTKDVFKLARIIKVSGAKDDLKSILGEKDASQVGFEFIMTLVTACGEEPVEKQLYDLFGDIAEKKPEDIKDMDIEDLAEMLKEISEQNNLSNFFSAAVKSA